MYIIVIHSRLSTPKARRTPFILFALLRARCYTESNGGSRAGRAKGGESLLGHLGFSYVGLLFLLAVIVPNLLWARRPPKGYSPAGENRGLLCFERAGEVSVSCICVCFSDFTPRVLSPWTAWLAAAILLMLLYELWWVRYFRGGCTLSDFYGGFLRIPVAGATLPVAAFFLLGIYGRVIWLLLATVILGIGHIGIHLQHRRELLS